MIDLLIYESLPTSLVDSFEQRFLNEKPQAILFEQYRALLEEHELNDFQMLTWIKMLSDNNCIYSSLLLAIYLSPITKKRLAIKSHSLSYEALTRVIKQLDLHFSSETHGLIVRHYPEAHKQACRLYLIYCQMYNSDENLKDYCELICDLYKRKQ